MTAAAATVVVVVVAGGSSSSSSSSSIDKRSQPVVAYRRIGDVIGGSYLEDIDEH